MDIYLDAECVLAILAEKNIIIDLKDWKRQHPENKKYSETFQGKDNGVVIFEFSNLNGRYCVPKLSLSILAYRHHFDADSIYNNCAIA